MAQSGHSQPSAARAAAIKNRIEAIRASAFSSPSCKEEELGDGVARFSGGIDQLFGELWRDLVGQDEDIAVVATGGWGRSEVGPYSDLDFVLLSERPQGEVAPLAERLLYPLWDAGLSVGHSVGSPREVARLAKNDVATATAMLDARWIVGDQRLADELRRRTSAAIAPGGNANQFVADLVEQMQHRHRRFGASLYLLEPHLKQGIGALRDLDTIGWVARARYGAYDLADLVDMGQLSARQVHIAKSARRFLLELRSLLQMSVGRRTDQLTFEVQERIAPVVVGEVERAEGDIRPAVAPAVEALMQRYYLHARGVLTVAERFLEAARIPKRKKPRLARVDASFLLFNGQLAVKDAKVFDDRPSEMVRTFRKAAELDVPIYGHTKDLIEERMAGGPVLQGDPVASRLLLDALCDLRDERQPSLLEQMHQVGLLSELMPEFGPCTCRVQHDLYHVYTVDQHQLKAVAMLKRHLRGQEQDIAGKVRLAVAEVKRPEVLALGMLLHDVGKPLGKGHSEKGAQLARVIGGRLGMRRDDLEVVEFLVRQHLTMSHLSQRRDLSDPDVIQRFAGIVESEERLAYLYLLTRCDAAMTAPGNLTSWKDQLLGELYDKTRSHLHGTFSEAELSVQDQAELARQRAVERVRRRAADESKEAAEAQSAEMRAFVDSLDDRFVLQMSSGQLLRVFRTARKREATGRPMALYVAHFPLKKHSEVVVVAEDSPGLLADVTGVLTASRVDVLEAAIGTGLPDQPGNPPLAVDLFHVRDLYGKAIDKDDPRWQKIEGELEEVLRLSRSGPEVEALIEKRRASGLKPRVTPAVGTLIVLDNEASSDYSVVEVFTKDVPGVLHSITRCLADLGLDIHLAKIGAEGERVADAFYVADGRAIAERLGNGKLTPERFAKVREALEDALVEDQEDE